MKYLLLTMLLASKLLSADYAIEFDRHDFDRALIRQRIEDASRIIDGKLQKVIIREKISVVDGMKVKKVYFEVTYTGDIDMKNLVIELDKMCEMKTTMTNIAQVNKEGG